ncbi:hypothetical protein SNEBB_005039 [Seison nebaliae]|nr:hypothetical protein SNEBB_005039 [Seison nebaliae]
MTDKSSINYRMCNVRINQLTELKESAFVRPYSVDYEQDGKKKKWDLIQTHESVAQFRPAVFMTSCLKNLKLDNVVEMTGKLEQINKEEKETNGCTIEACAGLVDKKKPLIEIVQEEIEEECGYHVPLANINFITTYRSGVGTGGSMQHFYYVEVKNSMKIGRGGGVEQDGELIEVVEFPISTVYHDVVMSEKIARPPSLLFGILWFLHNAEKYRRNLKK